MIGHDHVLVPHFLVGAHRLQHVDVALVGEYLHEVVQPPLDVPEVDVEDLLPGAEIADDVVDLLRGVLQAFRHAALAEVQPVVGTVVQVDKLLEAVRHAQYAGDAAVRPAVPDTRVRRVAGHLDLVFLGHGDDGLQPVLDAFPHFVLVGGPAFEFRPGLIELVVIEGRQLRTAAAVLGLGAQVAQQRDVVVQSTYPGLGGHAHGLAHAVQRAVPFIALSQENRPGLVFEGAGGTQGDMDHFKVDPVPVEPFTLGFEQVGRPLGPGLGRCLVHVEHAELGQYLDIRVVSAPGLRSDVHVYPPKANGDGLLVSGLWRVSIVTRPS